MSAKLEGCARGEICPLAPLRLHPVVVRIMLASFTAIVALLPIALAQTNPTLQVQSIDAQFDAAYIVPDLLKDFNPSAFLTLDYNGKEVAAGSPLTVDESSKQPELSITAANSSVTLGSTFTLALVDPGAIGGANGQQTRHWLVNGVTIGDAGKLVFPDPSKDITQYGGPLPPENSGAHRYVFLLYDQPSTFAPQGDLANPNQPITAFDVNEYASLSGLGAVVAATYFTCEQGTATPATITSAVNTATLPAAQTSGSGRSSAPSNTQSANTSTTSSSGAGFVNTASRNAVAALALLGFTLA